MREKRTFAQRTRVLASKETKRKFFLVFEGKKTEQIYFDAINDNRASLGIDPLIELIPLVRSYSEDGWSNPQKIMEQLLADLKESQQRTVSYHSLLDWMTDYFQETAEASGNGKQTRNFYDTLLWGFQNNFQASLDDPVENLSDACSILMQPFKEETALSDLVKTVPEILQNRGITYEEGFDKICFIIDRDPQSFKADQYQYVLNQCRQHGFGFYLTNPCFEFWLLLHFDQVLQADREKLQKNPRGKANRANPPATRKDSPRRKFYGGFSFFETNRQKSAFL